MSLCGRMTTFLPSVLLLPEMQLQGVGERFDRVSYQEEFVLVPYGLLHRRHFLVVVWGLQVEFPLLKHTWGFL